MWEPCKICGGKGFVKYSVETNGESVDGYARCSCKRGDRYSGFPTMEQVGLFYPPLGAV